MKIQAAYQAYAAYFLVPAIQANIRTSKEEQFQEGFLRELFVKALGYTLNPSPNYNLITEKENVTDTKKADGAILIDETVKAMIELKDHKTTDLRQIGTQAFGYKNNNLNTSYVITSNFEGQFSFNKQLRKTCNHVLKRLSDNLNIKANSALTDFYKSDFKQILAELKRQKASLTLKQQDEWESYFDKYKSRCSKLADKIQTTDEEIDRCVYELYGLTEEEIKIIDNNNLKI
jgi:hypothetical protein